MRAEEQPGPFFYQPDPDQPTRVQAKGLRLERRGPGSYVIVGVTPDGRLAEAMLGPASLNRMAS